MRIVLGLGKVFQRTGLLAEPDIDLCGAASIAPQAQLDMTNKAVDPGEIFGPFTQRLCNQDPRPVLLCLVRQDLLGLGQQAAVGIGCAETGTRQMIEEL